MNVDPNNIIRIELVQDKAVLWKFDLNWTIPDHLAQARWNLDGYVFRYLQHFKESNPILKSVAVAAAKVERLQIEEESLTKSTNELSEKKKRLIHEKERLEREIINLIQHKGYNTPMDNVNERMKHEFVDPVVQNINQAMYEERNKAIIALEKIPGWIRWIFGA